jgi:hypothetical protein
VEDWQGNFKRGYRYTPEGIENVTLVQADESNSAARMPEASCIRTYHYDCSLTYYYYEGEYHVIASSCEFAGSTLVCTDGGGGIISDGSNSDFSGDNPPGGDQPNNDDSDYSDNPKIELCADGSVKPKDGDCPPEPCDTEDPILDNSEIQSDLKNILWSGSNALDVNTPMGDRSEQGGWIVATDDGFDIVFFPPNWSRDACGINPPSNWANNIPDNVVGVVHSHPYYLGEDRSSVCGEDRVEDAYAGGPSRQDLDFLIVVMDELSDFNLKGYVIDGSSISQYDISTAATMQYQTYNRCGY